MEEVSFLGSRNAELEEQLFTSVQSKEEVRSLTQRNNLLLTLLGEKSEELEAALADMQEVKFLYRSQMDELLLRIAPPAIDATAAETTTTSSV